MKFSSSLPLAALLYAAGSLADHDDKSSNSTHAAVNCRNDICFSVVVPEATAESGSGALYFQIYAPTKFAWVGMGTGSGMANANMFLIYQDGKGNVTLSNRQASGYTMPQVPSSGGSRTQLLAGSGVKDGFMVANFRCDNCTRWKDNQQLDLSSSEASMIGAWHEGDSLDSDNVNERISKHTGSPRRFTLDLSKAQVSEAGNPFVGDHAIPAPLAENNTESGAGGSGGSGGSDGGDGGSAGVGRYALFSGSVATAAFVTALSLVL